MARRRSGRRQDQLRTWSGGLHKSFRILPLRGHSNEDLLAFLNSEEGEHRSSIHARLPFDRSRSRRAAEGADEDEDEDEEQDPAPEDDDDEDDDDDASTDMPDPKRYRDPKQVFETCGLLWEEDDRIHFTHFGRTLKRFMPHATERNVGLIAQHAALGLNVCQLRNPTGAGQRYHVDMRVFPFRFIWRVMLELDHCINSHELNRAVFATRNWDMLPEAIERIRTYRRTGNLSDLGEETVTGGKKNDRIIAMICLASFGWTLIDQKDRSKYYRIKRDCAPYLRAALNVPVEHRDYDSVEEYVSRISAAACLPKDVR